MFQSIAEQIATLENQKDYISDQCGSLSLDPEYRNQVNEYFAQIDFLNKEISKLKILLKQR